MKPLLRQDPSLEARRLLFDRVEVCTTELLRRQPGHTLSLQRLHDALLRELGAAAGTYHQLQQRLKHAHAVFRVVERPGPLTDMHTWPLELREQYTGALRAAGLDLSPLVILVGPSESLDAGLLGGLEATLTALQARAQKDPALESDVRAVFSDLPELLEALAQALPTTTPPRNPAAEP
jgi:hypothetical protein